MDVSQLRRSLDESNDERSVRPEIHCPTQPTVSCNHVLTVGDGSCEHAHNVWPDNHSKSILSLYPPSTRGWRTSSTAIEPHATARCAQGIELSTTRLTYTTMMPGPQQIVQQ